MPSPLDFIQSMSQKLRNGSSSEGLGAKVTTDENNGPKAAEAFSSALNQALRSKLTKTGTSNAPNNEKQMEAATNENRMGSVNITEQALTNPEDRTAETDKKSKEERAVEIAMAEGMTTPQPLPTEPTPPSEESGIFSMPTDGASASDESEGNTKRLEDTAPLAQSVSFSALSSEALIMMGLPAEFQVQTIQQTTPLANSPAEVNNALPGSLSLETSALPAEPLNTPMNFIQTNFGLPQSLPIPGNTQGSGFEEALQSKLPEPMPTQNQVTQNQVNDLAHTDVPEETSITEQQAALELSGEPVPNELNPMLSQTNTPDSSLTSNTLQNSTTETMDSTTSPLTTSLPETTHNTQTLVTEFSLSAQEIRPAEQGLPAPFSAPSPEAAEEWPTVSTAVNPPLNNRLQESATTPKAEATANNANKSTMTLTTSTINELLKPITDLQQSLSALNGEIESLIPDQDAESSTAFSSEEAASLGSSDPATNNNEPLPPLPFSANVGAPTSIGEPNTANASGKVPQFASLAQNPVDQVVDGTVYSVKNGHKELILKINPDNLGEVRIRLTSHGNNEMSARLIASTPESHELLKTQAETLKTSLEAQGIHLEKLSVMLAGQTDPGTNPNKQDQPSQFQQQPSNHSQSQQQSFQQSNQSFNPFFQANNGAYQNKQGFAQNPGSTNYGTGNGREEHSGGSAEPVSRRNDNGNVSVLA